MTELLFPLCVYVVMVGIDRVCTLPRYQTPRTAQIAVSVSIVTFEKPHVHTYLSSVSYHNISSHFPPLLLFLPSPPFLLFSPTARNPYTDQRYLIAVVPKGILLMQWYQPMNAFKLVQVRREGLRER